MLLKIKIKDWNFNEDKEILVFIPIDFNLSIFNALIPVLQLFDIAVKYDISFAIIQCYEIWDIATMHRQENKMKYYHTAQKETLQKHCRMISLKHYNIAWWLRNVAESCCKIPTILRCPLFVTLQQSIPAILQCYVFW